MNKKKIFTFGDSGFLDFFVSAINLVLGIVAIKILWSTIAEALFSKLITTDQISTSMTWNDAFWIGLLLYFIIRAFSGNLFKVIKEEGKTTVTLGDSHASVNHKNTEDKKRKNKDQ